jgi:hypothetical protein
MSTDIEHLATKEFSSAIDSWTETLCLEPLPDGGCFLSSRSHEIVAAIDDFPLSDDGQPQIPDEVRGKRVWQEGDFLVSETLTPHAEDSVAEFAYGEAEDDLSWLADYGWRGTKDWPRIERRVREVLGS